MPVNILKHPLVTPEQEQRIAGELQSGERLVFLSPLEGAPGSFRLRTRIFGVVWLGMCLFFTCHVGSYTMETGKAWWMSEKLVIIPFFVLVGLLVLALPRILSAVLRKTVVAFTDRRVIVAHKKRLDSLPVDDVLRLFYTEHPDRSGTLGFDAKRPVASNVTRMTTYPPIEHVSCPFPHVMDIERVLRTACLSAQRINPLPDVVKAVSYEIDGGMRDLIDAHRDPDETVIWAEQAHQSKLYALTDKRAMVLEGVNGSKIKVSGYPLDRIEIVEQVNRKGGRGDLIFYRHEYTAGRTNVVIREGFVKLRDVNTTGKLLSAMSHTARPQ